MSTKPKLRVWHIPQVPGKAFHVDVESPAEAAKILEVLAEYDLFQFKCNIKPDYCNAGGLTVKEGDDWVTWCDKDGDEIDEWSEKNKSARR